VRIVWKHDPLDFHKDAPLAHFASMAAGQQGKFWEFHDKVFAGQPRIQKDFLLQYARELGLDMKRFEQDLYSTRSTAPIDADVAEAKALGVSGTPAFFINGHFLSGAKPFEEFARSINEELTRLNVPVPAAAASPAPVKKGG
jgi:predicted DsbA family dithiol-disulfide isomerase